MPTGIPTTLTKVEWNIQYSHTNAMTVTMAAMDRKCRAYGRDKTLKTFGLKG
jgi:hypothetical protein